MSLTRGITLVTWAVVAGILACLYGIYQVSHGHSLPLTSVNSIFTMPAVALVLAILAWPIYRYRKQLLEFGKANQAAENSNKPNTPVNGRSPSGTVASGQTVGKRPTPLNPFYAVRVLLLAKSTAVAAAAIGGWHAGLIALQLSTPVVAPNVWNNVLALIGALLAMAVALAVERICKLPSNSNGAAGSSEATPA